MRLLRRRRWPTGLGFMGSISMSAGWATMVDVEEATASETVALLARAVEEPSVVGEGSMPRAPEAAVEAEVVACGTASGNRGELDAEDSAEVEVAAMARRGKAAMDSRRGVLFFEEPTSDWGGDRGGGGGGGDEEGIIHGEDG